MNKLFCIFAAVMLCGCHTYPVPEILPNARVLKAPKDQVWPILLHEVSDRYAIQALDQPSGFLATSMTATKVGRNYTWKWIQDPSRFIFRHVNGLSVALACRVTDEADGKTKVEIIPDFEVLYSDGFSRVKSNGHLENEIFDRVALKLEGKK